MSVVSCRRRSRGSVRDELDVGEIRNRLDSIGGDSVQVELRGEADEPIACGIRLAGELETWIPSPTSEKVLENIPEWLPPRFSDDEVYTSKEGDRAPVIIDTEVSEIEKIIWAVENPEDTEFFPLIVDDGERRLRVGGKIPISTVSSLRL